MASGGAWKAVQGIFRLSSTSKIFISRCEEKMFLTKVFVEEIVTPVLDAFALYFFRTNLRHTFSQSNTSLTSYCVIHAKLQIRFFRKKKRSRKMSVVEEDEDEDAGIQIKASHVL